MSRGGNGLGFTWTPERLARASSSLLARGSYEEAAKALSDEFGCPVTSAMLRGAMRRVGQAVNQRHDTQREVRLPTREEVAAFQESTSASPSEPVERPSSRDELERHGLRERVRELEAAKKRLLDELAERDAMLGIADELRKHPPRPVVAKEGRGEGMRRLGVPVMLLSDWHVEEPVKPESVSGLNEYNLEIAERCIGRCAEAFEWLTRDPRYEMREAVVWLGGDLFSGFIHEELMEQNFLSPVQAVTWLQDRLEGMLRRILAETQFERIIVPCNDGNHGRLTNRIRVATRTANSLEWLLYKSLASRFRGEERVEFQIAGGEYNYLDVYDQTLCFFHGDSVRYLGGVGGLLIPMKRGLNELRKYRKVDVFNFGHFHTRLDLPNMTGNGSMIGINSYAMRIKAEPEPRQQSFYVLDSTKGKCLSAPVWL